MPHHRCTTFEEEAAKIPELHHGVCDDGRLSLLLDLVSTAVRSHGCGEEHAKQDNSFLPHTSQ